ncbi:MAG: hypothetical protein ACOZQL_02510 [Myxococcota bacterium]
MGQGTVFRVSEMEFRRLLTKTAPLGESVAAVEQLLNITWPDSDEPTANELEFARRVRVLRQRGSLPKPNGAKNPAAVVRNNVTVYVRDPNVRAWVLQQAAGRCELCGSEAPFEDKDGLPFLETPSSRR